MTSAEFGAKVGLSPVRVRELAREGRVTGARKSRGRWEFSPSSRIIRPLSATRGVPAGDDYEHRVKEFFYWSRRLLGG